MNKDCKHMGFHAGGSWQSVAEGGDDPYTYYFCVKKNWSDGDEPEPGHPHYCDDCDFYDKDSLATD
jgi:hypothetical protein